MPARFVFNLQVVLEHRRRAERRAQTALGELLAERAAIVERLAGLRRGVEAARDDARGRMVGRVTPADLRAHAAGELGADRRARALATRLAGVDERVARARAALRRAAVERDALERLRARKLALWRERQQRAERLEQDDIQLMRSGRTGPGG